MLWFVANVLSAFGNRITVVDDVLVWAKKRGGPSAAQEKQGPASFVRNKRRLCDRFENEKEGAVVAHPVQRSTRFLSERSGIPVAKEARAFVRCEPNQLWRSQSTCGGARGPAGAPAFLWRHQRTCGGTSVLVNQPKYVWRSQRARAGTRSICGGPRSSCGAPNVPVEEPQHLWRGFFRERNGAFFASQESRPAS